jgi:hypothetical protein
VRLGSCRPVAGLPQSKRSAPPARPVPASAYGCSRPPHWRRAPCTRRFVGRLKDPDKVLLQLGRLKERYRKAWGYVKISFEDLRLSWRWDRPALRLAASRDGAYLFALTWTVAIRRKLWTQYVQLTEGEAVFRALKSDLAIRSIWPGAQIRSADARCRLLDKNSGNRNKKRPVSQILDSSTAKQNACGRAVR